MELNDFDREYELKKKIELLHAEQEHYKHELEKDNNFKIVYHESRGLYSPAKNGI